MCVCVCVYIYMLYIYIIKVLERKIKTEAEPSSIARTQRQLGGILDDLGRYDGAVKCYRGALEVHIYTVYIHLCLYMYIYTHIYI